MTNVKGKTRKFLPFEDLNFILGHSIFLICTPQAKMYFKHSSKVLTLLVAHRYSKLEIPATHSALTLKIHLRNKTLEQNSIELLSET